MKAKEARETSIKNAERRQRRKLHYQLEKDERMLERAVNDAIEEGRLYACVSVEFELSSVLKYDCGKSCDICCHFGEFHSQTEYLKNLVKPYMDNGYRVRFYRSNGYEMYYDELNDYAISRTQKLRIEW